MSEKTELIYVSFCSHSWKVFMTERLALDWIEERETDNGELWSVTPAKVSFCTPYLRTLGNDE